MKDYYCFEISFTSIDLDNFMPNSEKSISIHHAHLYSKINEIEIKIFFESKTYFGRKLSIWASRINWRDFGSFIHASKESQNDRLKKIDFLNSTLLSITNGTNQYEGKLEYVSIKIDSVKFYWNPLKSEYNTAAFYFNEAGFKVVSDFYAPLFGSDGDFKISRMKGMDEFYKIDKAEFRPEFDFSFSDDKSNSETRITKDPVLKFRYKENITEEEAIKYAEIIRLLASFYLHLKIDYTLSRIHLLEHTITIKKIHKESITSSSGSLSGFKNYWDFHKFMQSNWKQHALKNYKKLSKVIEMFNQSLTVDNISSFLIRFNIIEICMSGIKITDEKFQSVLSETEKQKIYNEASTLLLQTIMPSDHEDFLAKWEGVKNKLAYKPMKSPLLNFFESQKLTPSKFPISVNKIKDIRDKITHGSINKVKHDQLEKANILLYRITGILILNLLGIDEWTLDTGIE
jgi:hypothetical protein